MSVVEQQQEQPSQQQQTPQQGVYTTMPCGFEEEFVDFESAAHQYSISTDEWGISELDEEALGISDGGGRTAEADSTAPATTTG